MHHGKGFRLPTVSELITCFSYYEGKVFPGHETLSDKLVWAASPYPGDLNQAYHVNMKNGLVNYSRNDNQHFVVYVKDVEVDDGYGEEIEILDTNDQLEEMGPFVEEPRDTGISEDMLNRLSDMISGKIEMPERIKNLITPPKKRRGRAKKGITND
jgi:hypothetical protein